MSQEIRKIIAGAISGFLSAFVVDVMAWSKHRGVKPFNWGVAAKRWVAGVITGVVAALGVGQVE